MVDVQMLIYVVLLNLGTIIACCFLEPVYFCTLFHFGAPMRPGLLLVATYDLYSMSYIQGLHKCGTISRVYLLNQSPTGP